MTSTTTVRRFVISMEILCSLLALAILSFGIYILCIFTAGFERSVAYGFVLIGGATLLVFLINGCGFLKGGVCCISTYVIFYLLVITVQIVAAVLLISSVNPAASAIANTVDMAWEDELKNPGAMSLYEDWLTCCGRVSAQDYIVNNRDPPTTCFKNHDKTNADNLLVQGCRLEFENYWFHWLVIFEILAWVLISFEILTSLLLCCLCNHVRNERRRQFI